MCSWHDGTEVFKNESKCQPKPSHGRKKKITHSKYLCRVGFLLPLMLIIAYFQPRFRFCNTNSIKILCTYYICTFVCWNFIFFFIIFINGCSGGEKRKVIMEHYFMPITIISLVLVLELVQYNKFANSNINLELPLFAGIFLEFVCSFSLSRSITSFYCAQFNLYYIFNFQDREQRRPELNQLCWRVCPWRCTEHNIEWFRN